MSTTKKVTVVAHPTTGVVITPSTKNPEWGTFRVDSEHKSFQGGILNIQKRSAFVRGKLEDLGSLNLRAGQVMSGQIIKRESFAPFYENQPAKINPTTKEEVLTNGQKTYLEYVYTDNTEANDEWVGQTASQMSAEAAAKLAEQATN